MTIYIDTLFLTNFFMDSFLLLTVSFILKNKITIYRILLSATFLSAYGCVIFFVDSAVVTSLILKLFVSVLGIYIALGKEHIIRNTAVFWITSCLCGGIILSISILSSFGTVMEMSMSNYTLYMNLSPAVLIIGCLALYLSAEIIKRIYIKNFSRDKLIVDINFIYLGIQYTVKALIDTGCSLTEPLSGDAMLIIDKNIIKTYDTPKIYVNTVSGKSELDLIFAEKVWTDDVTLTLNPKTPIAVSCNKINEENIYNAILNPDALISIEMDRKEIEKDYV